MNVTIFMKIYFEKVKYFILYGLLSTTFWCIMMIRVYYSSSDVYYEEKTPDLEISGVPIGLKNGYMLYDDLAPEIINNIVNSEVDIYGLVVRNIYTFSDSFYQVSYKIYGAGDDYLSQLEGYLDRGRLPETGKREAVIGSSAAKYFNVKVGGVIDIPVSLSKDNSNIIGEYIISGILVSDAEFFSNNIFISKDTYKILENDVQDNIIYIYTDNNKIYDSLIMQFKKMMNEGITIGIVSHLEDKSSLTKAALNSLLQTLLFSFVFIGALFLSMFKHIGKKIGLMKALGIPEFYLIKVVGIGLGIHNLVGLLTSFLSTSLIILVGDVPMMAELMLYNILTYLIIFLVTFGIVFIKFKLISPKDSMI